MLQRAFTYLFLWFRLNDPISGRHRGLTNACQEDVITFLFWEMHYERDLRDAANVGGPRS